MFHANRARQHQGADHRIHGGAAAHAAPDRPAKDRSRGSSHDQPVTGYRRAVARDIGVRSGLVLLAFAILTVLGGTLVGRASASSHDAAAPQARLAPSTTTGLPERVVEPTQTTQPSRTHDQPSQTSAQTGIYLLIEPVKPAKAVIAAGEHQGYTAKLRVRVGPDQWSYDVTRWTRFAMDPDGSCEKSRSKASCSATIAGPHRVIGFLPPGVLPLVKLQLSGTAEVLVVPGELVGIQLQPGEAEIKAGESQRYIVKGIDRYGNPHDGDLTSQTEFSISPSGSCRKDATTATCTSTSADVHTVTVRVTATQLTGTAILHVTPGELAKLELTPTPATIVAGTPQRYHADGFDSYGNPLGDHTAQTEFSISPSGSCTKVGAEASCTATKVGDYTVTGTVDLGSRQVTGQAALHVGPGGLDTLTLDPNPARIVAGSQQRYHAEGLDRYGNPLGDHTAQTEFSISPSGSCTKIGTEASCTVTKAGDYTVTGTVDLGSRQVTGQAALHVDPGELARLELRPGRARTQAGAHLAYQAWGFDAHNNPLGERTAQTVLSVAPPESCTIAGALVSCTIARSYKVTGTLNGIRDTATLKVMPAELAGIQLQPDNAEIQAGAPQRYTVSGVDRHGNVRVGDLTARTDLSISPSGLCTKDAATATCTATKAGDYTVTGTLNTTSFRDTAKLVVVPGELAGIRLEPDRAEIQAGASQRYTVRGVDQHGNVHADDLADRTSLSINPPGSCSKAGCTATTPGAYTVTGTLNGSSFRDTAELLVVGPRLRPRIATVTPGSTPAGRAVEVRGNTGSCSRAGTLTFPSLPGGVSMKATGDERGNFVARFTVPTGTFPNAYKLQLTVDCNGQTQRAEGELSVVNLAPVAVDDSASTTKDTPVAIAVTANDRNPDPDTGYATLVMEHGVPANGTIQVQPDGIIVYTPRAGFLGQDQFQYGLCDKVINAAGTADCGIATVFVTVNPTIGGSSDAGAAGGGSSGGGAAGGGSTTTDPCSPSAGDLRQPLQVTPLRGPGGTRLHITAQVDPRLAACPLRLLLGATPVGPDVAVGLDGSIAAQLSVPTNAIPESSVLRLATFGGQVLGETPFEILPRLLRRWWERDPFRLLLGVGALLAGALTRAAIRRLRRPLPEKDQDELDRARPPGLRAEPHTRPPEVAVEPDPDARPTLGVRLQPHGDAGALTLQEVPG
jgi:Bacterial Ig domain